MNATATLLGLLVGDRIAEPDARPSSILIDEFDAGGLECSPYDIEGRSTWLVRAAQEKRGEVGPEDLSANLIVQLGLVTEDLNRQWYERNTGKAIKDVQARIRHRVIRWMAATLDGVVAGSGAVYEAKFMLPLVVLGGVRGR